MKIHHSLVAVCLTKLMVQAYIDPVSHKSWEAVCVGEANSLLVNSYYARDSHSWEEWAYAHHPSHDRRKRVPPKALSSS
jgi:hypothetical protein